MAPYELRPTSLSVGHKAGGQYVWIWKPDYYQYMHVQHPEREFKFWTYWEQTHPLTFTVPTWLQWVLNIEHGGPVAIHQVLLNLIFGNIATSIFDSDARFQVVEVASVQLKEFDEQNTDIDVGTAHILPVVKLENTRFEWMSELFQILKGLGDF